MSSVILTDFAKTLLDKDMARGKLDQPFVRRRGVHGRLWLKFDELRFHTIGTHCWLSFFWRMYEVAKIECTGQDINIGNGQGKFGGEIEITVEAA